jgi:hypothetical protein
MDVVSRVLSRRHVSRVVAPLAILAAVLAGAGQALARAGCTPGPGCCSPNGVNYYGEACLYGSLFTGMLGEIDSSTLYVPNGGINYHVINDMYIVNHTSSPVQFIEAGMITGVICTDQPPGGPCAPNSESGYLTDELFWGDERQNSNYYAHLEGPGSLNTTYYDAIYQEDSTDWYVDLGSNTGYSTNNPMQPNLIRAGTEVEPQSAATACSEQYDLAWENASYHWDYSGWSDSSHPNAYIEQDQPPYADWHSQNSWVYDFAGSSESQSSCAASFGFTPSLVSSTADPSLTSSPRSASSPSSPATGWELTESQVSRIAHGFAAGMGDSIPSSIEHVESTRDQAVFALSGDHVSGSDPEFSASADVYGIVMRGHFVAANAPRASDAAAPSGSVLTIVINGTTGQLTDLGLQNNIPDLTTLGPATVDQ